MGLLDLISGLIQYVFCIYPDEKKEGHYKQAEPQRESYPPYQEVKQRFDPERDYEWTNYGKAEKELAYRPGGDRHTGREVSIARAFWRKEYQDKPKPYPISLSYYYPRS
jgi:hypothetical protein